MCQRVVNQLDFESFFAGPLHAVIDTAAAKRMVLLFIVIVYIILKEGVNR